MKRMCFAQESNHLRKQSVENAGVVKGKQCVSLLISFAGGMLHVKITFY